MTNSKPPDQKDEVQFSNHLSGRADQRAVSPVIGVILLVAITVILSAVVAGFVLDQGDQLSNQPPQVSWHFEHQADDDVLIRHDGGDQVDAAKLTVKVDGSEATMNTSFSGTVTAGDSGEAKDVSSGALVQLVYERGNGRTAVIGSWEVP